MEVNLSDETIEKICRISFARIHDLDEKKKYVEDSITVGDAAIRRKHAQLKEIQKVKEDAEEVHAIFLEFMETIDPEFTKESEW